MQGEGKVLFFFICSKEKHAFTRSSPLSFWGDRACSFWNNLVFESSLSLTTEVVSDKRKQALTQIETARKISSSITKVV
jgi:hypothetical protein